MQTRRLLLWIIVCLLWSVTSFAQNLEASMWEIYVERNIDESGIDRVQLVNLISGETTSVDVTGERYTPVGSYLLFFDPVNREVLVARSDGTVEPHPFIQLGAARRVDWIVSDDERLIAWTLTYDNSDGTTTVTTISNPAGTNQNLVLSDGPRTDGVRVLPVAFTIDNNGLVMDSQPDGIGDLAPYRQYANLFELSLIDGAITTMPGEPSCFCAAALRAERLMRLAITADFSGYDVAIYNLVSGNAQSIESTGLVNYTQGGDILISPDGTLAVYALSQVELNSAEPAVRTVIMQVDLQSMTQIQLSDPVTSYLHPVQWTEDNTAVLFSIPERDGTWKIELASGEFIRIANATYIGTIES